MNNYEKALEVLKEYNQNHIIDFLQQETDEVKERIANQVLEINFNEMNTLYKKTFEDIYVDLEELEPVKCVKPEKLSIEEKDKLEKIGVEVIKNNKFAVATMAGGQGTRLRS